MSPRFGGRWVNSWVWAGAAVILVLIVSSLSGERSESRGSSSVAAVPRSNPYGILTSERWGGPFVRRDLTPVSNPNPVPEPQPRRDHPAGIALSPDGSKVYVALMGSELHPGHEVAVVDVAGRRVTKRIGVGSAPTKIVAHPSGRFLVVLNRFSNYASVIDVATDLVVAEIPLDFYSGDLVFTRDGRRGYVSNRYLGQVLVIEPSGPSPSDPRWTVRATGGFDRAGFFASGSDRPSVFEALKSSCGRLECHGNGKAGFYAGEDMDRTFSSAVETSVAGVPAESLLLRVALATEDGGYADDRGGANLHAGGLVVFRRTDPGYQAIERWVATARPGPGIPVENAGSKPGPLALSSDERMLYVGNQGVQSISVIDLERSEEVTAVYTQSLILDLELVRSAGKDFLVAASLGLGFGAPKERDPLGGESGDPSNPAAQFTVLRDLETTEPKPLEGQTVLGRFDAVDGTAAFKMNDIQNDLILVDVSRISIPPRGRHGELQYALKANRYESHDGWVRYTSDSAEVLAEDIGGDIPPELMRVVGAYPEAIAVEGERFFVAMAGSFEVVEWRLRGDSKEASERAEPVAVAKAGLMPRFTAVGVQGTPSAGLVFTSNFLGETISVVDFRRPEMPSSEIVVGDLSRPYPDTDAERGDMFVNTTIFSVDQDTACSSCHIFGTSDGRPWGAGQAIAQLRDGAFVSGGLLAIPPIRNLFSVQPFYFEGTHTLYDAQLDDAREHVALQGFRRPNPIGDFTAVLHPTPVSERPREHEEIQDKTSTRAWGDEYYDLIERRDVAIRRLTMKYFGKAYDFRDFERFIGEYQAVEPRLSPSPYDQNDPAVRRGRMLFNDLGVGCSICHRAPSFTDKSEALTHNEERVLPSLVTFTERERSFTVVSPHYMDTVNGVTRDVEPWDKGRIERVEGSVTTFSLRGLFDRPFTFLHNGSALSVRESFTTPGHDSLRKLRYVSMLGGEPVRVDGREIGANQLSFLEERGYVVDTHGATSHLTVRQVRDLESFLLTIE
ncbi:MAG: YncE family protein [Deltaproteobacteria bacterium]|nr:YncE family protein [Deltaproteobacteria bacterium]